MASMVADRDMLWTRPLTALADGMVVMGNKRLLAARELGWKTIPTVIIELDLAQAKVWALKDNNSYGEWDEPRLGELLAEMAASGIDLALTGFSSADLDLHLAAFARSVDADEVPALAPGEPDSQPGEIYRLGEHMLACGDATDADLVARVCGDEQVEVLLTDPPYGVDYEGKTVRRLRITNDQAPRVPALLAGAFTAADVVLAPSARFYVAAPIGTRGTAFRLALEQIGWQFHEELVWVKNSAVVGHSDYQIQHESILYGWKVGPGRPGRGRHHGSRWYGDNTQTTVLFFDRPTRSSDHPTMKPVALLEAMLRNSSRRGDLVLDPFAGSGSALIACERLGRRCRAIEIDPGYCDVIRRRYEALSNG